MRDSEQPAIGYIGIGLMGEAMVARLLDGGFRVTVWNRTPAKCDAVVKAGAAAAASPAAVVRATDIVRLCVYDAVAVEDCVFGSDGVVEAANSDKVLVDHSTIRPEATIRMAKRLRDETGMAWVDAPVSGGPEGSRNGTLTIMAGGLADDIARIVPSIGHLSANFTHMGPVGSGQAAKMINQLLVGVGFQIVAEAVRLAETTGLDIEKIPACLAGGRGDSGQLQACFARVARREFDPPTGHAAQMLKDMDALVDHARANNIRLPVTELATDILTDYVDAGNGDQDSVSIYRMLLQTP